MGTNICALSDQTIPCSRGSCRGCSLLVERAKEFGRGSACPFTPQAILCMESECGACEIRQAWDTAEDGRIAENMSDYLVRLAMV